MKNYLFTVMLVLIFLLSEYSLGQNMSLISSLDTPGEARDVELMGDYLFIADGDSGLSIVDISDPWNPGLVGNCAAPGQHLSIAVHSGYAYIAAVDNLQIFDISDYSNPILVSSLATPQDAIDVFVQGDYAYIANSGGFLTSGLIVVDISDKANPVIVGQCGTHYVGGLVARGDYVFMAADCEGLKIINVSDKNNPSIACEVSLPPQWPYTCNEAYDVSIKDNYAYLASRIGGLKIIDISDPYNAFNVQTHFYPLNTHDVFVTGDYVYISSQYDDGLAIFDISSPANFYWAGRYDAYLSITGLCALDSLVYAAGNVLYIFDFSPAFGRVSGSVTDIDTHIPVESVTVQALPSAKCGVSGSNGIFVIDSLYNFTYDLKFSHPDYFDTTLGDVQIIANDNVQVLVQMTHRAAVDAGVSGILDIPYPFVEGREYPLKSEVNNFGSTEQSIYFAYDVYLSGSASPEISDTLYLPDMPGGSIDTLLFPTTFVPLPETTYTLLSYSILAGDEDPSNDTTEIQVESINYYNIFYGDPYGAPLEANIGSIVEMTVWGSAPLNIDQDNNGVVDSINFMINTLASPDSIITSRYPSRDPQDTLPARSYFPFYPLNDWDDVEVFPEINNSPVPGLSTQTMWGTTNIIDPQDDPLFNTMGDTIPLFVFAMRTAMDTSLLGRLIFPFQRGYFMGTETGLLWGIQDGVTLVYPDDHYCGLRFYTESELGYIVGNVTDLEGNPLQDVEVSIEDAFREDSTDPGGNFALSWITPGTYDVAFSHPSFGDKIIADVSVTAGDTTVLNLAAGYCDYVAGDVNGSGHADGLDIVYLVSYLKGGEYPPDTCSCPGHGILFAAADANGSCSVNGLDVTYLVSYFKGGPAIMYCADCPPVE